MYLAPSFLLPSGLFQCLTPCLTALTQRQTADVLGLGSGAAVSLQLRRLADELPSTSPLRQRVDRILAALADPEAGPP
jgi:hypothetical protein